MPFLDSQTIRPLYDVHQGGPPVGFRCMYCWQCKEVCHKIDRRECGRVVRTLAGMRSHQRIVHGIKLQQEFQFDRL